MGILILDLSPPHNPTSSILPTADLQPSRLVPEAPAYSYPHLQILPCIPSPPVPQGHTPSTHRLTDPTTSNMHRTYSMRQSRAPTASQLQNPPPPPSSTKSGRLFGKGSFGHALRRNAGGAFGPDLAKKLMEVASQLSVWGEAGDEDVSDVTDKLGVLLYEIGELEDQYVDRYDQYRVTIKSIRNIEAS